MFRYFAKLCENRRDPSSSHPSAGAPTKKAMESANDWAHFLADMAKGQNKSHHQPLKHLPNDNLIIQETCEENMEEESEYESCDKMTTSVENVIYANQIDDLKVPGSNEDKDEDKCEENEGYYILPNKGMRELLSLIFLKYFPKTVKS